MRRRSCSPSRKRDSLDMTEPWHPVGAIDWDRVRSSKTTSPKELFAEVICNPQDCPFGYERCEQLTGHRWKTSCYYWDILFSVLEKEHNANSRVA